MTLKKEFAELHRAMKAAVELHKLRRGNKRMRAALFKIMDLYAKAPGWANPTPTTKLVWGMYQTALKAAAGTPHVGA